ncbi:MAG: GNAT family N-acetyltransferase [Anaerolineales bacterium]|nr:GNAT family N-acetyltransferase [Anaerolineales bacterium]
MDIEIRPLMDADLAVLRELDHSYHTDYVWQMSLDVGEQETSVNFKEVRLPRSMRVEYPWPEDWVHQTWQKRNSVLIAVVDDQTVGYLSLVKDDTARLVRITNLVVLRRLRRRQIGSTLLQAAEVWMAQQGAGLLQLEMQVKNHPAICMAKALGYEFNGYRDEYFPNRDIALFFARRI